MRLDSTQHNHASMAALVKYLYSADLRVDPNCGVYLSNCTDFFGLSSNALEHACQELVSQHHCLKVLKSAWRSCNEGLFKRACKFIDWTTLAALMNGQGAGSATSAAARLGSDQMDADEDDGEQAEDDDEEEAGEGEDDEEGGEGEGEGEQEAGATVAASASASASPPPSSLSSLRRRGSPSATAAAAAAAAADDASSVEMWKAIVSEKANPSASGGGPFSPFGSFGKHAHSSTNKRARTSS